MADLRTADPRAPESASRPRKALTIGAVCKILQSEFDDVSISKIRYLEDQKLLNPRRTSGGYRLYSQSDVERLRTILRLQRDEFLPLRVIRQELAAGGDIVLGDGRAQAGQRRGAAGDPGRHLARLPDPRRGGRGDRRPRGADRRAGELRHRPAGETRGQDRLRRDRPRDRPRRQRTLAGRGRRPQPARLPLLRRPRGATCWKRCSAPRCARATPSAARRRWRAWRAWRRRSATSSTCCWSATCAAWPATERRAACRGSPAAARSRRPSREVWELVSDPYSLPRWWPRTSRVENVERKAGGRRSQWTKVLETSRGARRAGRLPLRQLGRGRALRLGAGAGGHAVRAPPAQLAGRDRAARARTAGPRSTSARCRRCKGCRGSARR